MQAPDGVVMRLVHYSFPPQGADRNGYPKVHWTNKTTEVVATSLMKAVQAVIDANPGAAVESAAKRSRTGLFLLAE